MGVTERNSRAEGSAESRRGATPGDGGHGLRLPPGQRPVAGFPRFGTHLHHAAPVVRQDHAIRVTGAVTEDVELPLAGLARLPRHELVADFHCVAGWSALDLRWEGVSFRTFYRAIVEPVLDRTLPVTHVVFVGLDGYRSAVLVEDALGDDVLIAENLDGRPLDGDHGAPVRLVSPGQYGYVNIKHLSEIEIRTAAPVDTRSPLVAWLLKDHPRSRVWQEERHGSLPARWLRPVYRSLIPAIRALSARGGDRRR